MDGRDLLPMGEISRRSGFAASAIRYYEAEGLIEAHRALRGLAVAAHADVANPPGQWNLHVQVIHWRGDTVTGGRDALESLEWARMALASCQMTAAEVSPSVTTSTPMDLAAVISDGGRRVMHTYLIVDPASSSLVEMALWSTVPPTVEWRGVAPDTEVFNAMAAPLCEAYLGSCR